MQLSVISHLRLATILAMTIALTPLAIDTYLPAFPAIAQSLRVNVHEVALSISVYIFMLSIGQLIAGPLADRYGRQPIMLIGLGIFCLASALITCVNSNDSLIALRALQSFGGGWAMVCVPALVRDRLSGKEAAKFFSLIGLIMIIAPAIAPSIGSALLHFFSWQSIFVFLTIYAALMVVLLRAYVFNRHYQKPASHPHISALARYKTVFSNRPALRFLALQAMAFSVMMLFVTHASFIYQQNFGASPNVFSILFGANVVIMMVSNISNRRLLNVYSAQQILRWGLTIQGIGIVLLLLVLIFAPSLWLFLPAMMLTLGVMGAISPNIQACYMEYFAIHSGTAAALIGAAQFAVAGLISAGSSLLPESVLAIVLAQGACSVICLFLVWMPTQPCTQSQTT